MKKFFKKLLNVRNFSLIKNNVKPLVDETPVEVPLTQEEQLLVKLTEMVNYERLNELFYNPVSKLYVINTYTADFNDLTGSLYNANFRKQIIAINVHAYFLNSRVDIRSDLERIVKCLQTHKPNVLLQHDLDELVNTFEYLKALES